MKKSPYLFIGFSLLLVGCSSINQDTEQDEVFEILDPLPLAGPPIPTGSIFDNGSNLYPAGRAYSTGSYRVGDIITVVLDESAQASRETGLTTERVSNGVLTPDIFPAGTTANDLANLDNLGSTIGSVGNGTAGQSASLNGSISAIVQQVLSNGNLVIVGEKEIELNEGSEYIKVRGIVRPEDIQPNNTVLSRRLASAQFSYSGVGALANSTKTPIGTRLLYSLWPF
jgi:flagellar L-ring protein precursor FlgH